MLPRQAKILAILNIPIPKTRRELMWVLGMCGFYRRFVANFASVTEPLTNLLRKGVKFKWSELCQSAFERVKAILSCEPVLRAPDFSLLFKLAVDACEVASVQFCYKLTVKVSIGPWLTFLRNLVNANKLILPLRKRPWHWCWSYNI